MSNTRKNFTLKFVIFCKDTRTGENLYVSGSTQELGNWDISRAVKLSTNSSKFPSWESEEIPFIFEEKENDENITQTSSSTSSLLNYKVIFEYKYFIKNKLTGAIQWESFKGNRIFTNDMIQNILEKIESNVEQKHEYFFINGEVFNDKNTIPTIIKITDLTTDGYKEAYRKRIEQSQTEDKKEKKIKIKNHHHKLLKHSDTSPINNKKIKISENLQTKSESKGLSEPQIQPGIQEQKTLMKEKNQKENIDDKNKEILEKLPEDEFAENLNSFNIDNYLTDLEKIIKDIKNDKANLKSNLQLLFDSFKDKRNIDKELILLIFIHFVKSGQLKFPNRLSSFIEHRHHHDPQLARSLYTYLLANINYDNSLLIRSILSYVPTCLDYRVKEQVPEKSEEGIIFP